MSLGLNSCREHKNCIVVFDDYHCPVCKTIQNLEEDIEAYSDEVEEYEDDIRDLEDQVNDLELRRRYFRT